jgi:hypothetical protein
MANERIAPDFGAIQCTGKLVFGCLKSLVNRRFGRQIKDLCPMDLQQKSGQKDKSSGSQFLV